MRFVSVIPFLFLLISCSEEQHEMTVVPFEERFELAREEIRKVRKFIMGVDMVSIAAKITSLTLATHYIASRYSSLEIPYATVTSVTSGIVGLLLWRLNPAYKPNAEVFLGSATAQTILSGFTEKVRVIIMLAPLLSLPLFFYLSFDVRVTYFIVAMDISTMFLLLIAMVLEAILNGSI
jgi:hypothetical protein